MKSFEGLQEFLLIGVDPQTEWYPIPNGENDQDHAINGLKKTAKELQCFLKSLQEKYEFCPEQTALVGFSAGAVIALELALHAAEEYKMVISHNGAIFANKEIPQADKKTNFVLLHTQDDACFTWTERYVPMKNALCQKGYNVISIEHPIGGHKVFDEDIITMGTYLKNKFVD